MSQPSERGSHSAGYWQSKVRAEAFSLCAHLHKAKLLEIGCGEGFFLAQVATNKPDWECWGVDNSRERIEEARRRFSEKKLNAIQVSVQDATALQFDHESFHVVVCINVFFNMPSMEVVEKTLQQMYRVCKPQGIVIFDFRNALNPIMRVKYALAPWYDATVKHLPLRCYRLKTMEALVQRAGFKIRSRRYIGLSWQLFAPIIIIEAEK